MRKDLLGPGQLFGAAAGTLRVADATLMETRYAPGSTLPAHAHELPMFVFVAAGSFDESFETRQRTCGAGQLLYRPPGERHAQRFLGQGSACLTIEIPELDARALHDADGRLQLAGIPSLLAMRVYDEFRRSTTDALEVEELLANLSATAAHRRPVTERCAPAWLRSTQDAIEARFRHPLRLSDLARDAGVHRVHLSRTFRRFLGCGVAEFVRRRRVHAACASIRLGARRLSSIAAETGFADESHMGRAFREVMHCSPREYAASR
jgi:AraC family transcriptional regulator